MHYFFSYLWSEIQKTNLIPWPTTPQEQAKVLFLGLGKFHLSCKDVPQPYQLKLTSLVHLSFPMRFRTLRKHSRSLCLSNWLASFLIGYIKAEKRKTNPRLLFTANQRKFTLQRTDKISNGSLKSCKSVTGGPWISVRSPNWAP